MGTRKEVEILSFDGIFRDIQKIIANVPLLLIGSGSSAPHGLPGMGKLGEHLLDRLDGRHRADKNWGKFKENLDAGQDLETALSDVILADNILDDIKTETWKVMSRGDIELFKRIAFEDEQIPLARLIKKLYQAHPKCVNIITTNYDRVIEYACDSAQLPVNTGFTGDYFRQFNGCFYHRDAVNLIKVHGCLDVFRDSSGQVFSVPLLSEIPGGLVPEIITPGLSKFQAVLRGTARQLLTESDNLISRARSYLCIGYGFNDEQIQENIVARIRTGIPIIVVTRTISEQAACLLKNNAEKYVSIECGEEEGTTKFSVNNSIYTCEGTYWTVAGFMEIIE